MLPVIYEDIGFSDLHAHLNHLLSFPVDHPSAEIYLNTSELSFPLKIISYKTKPNVIEFRIRSGTVGRDNLLHLNEHLEKKGFDLRCRKSHKLKLLSAINVHIPCSSNMVVADISSMFKDILILLSMPIEQKFTICYPMGYETPELPGTFRYGDSISQLGYKVGRRIGLIAQGIKRTIAL